MRYIALVAIILLTGYSFIQLGISPAGQAIMYAVAENLAHDSQVSTMTNSFPLATAVPSNTPWATSIPEVTTSRATDLPPTAMPIPPTPLPNLTIEFLASCAAKQQAGQRVSPKCPANATEVLRQSDQ